jgi:hypothetical protein
VRVRKPLLFVVAGAVVALAICQVWKPVSYVDQVTRLGHRVMEAIALSLGLPSDYFLRRYTSGRDVRFSFLWLINLRGFHD